jgi:hypothetical protein
MHSSTSSSERRRAKVPFALVAALVGYFLTDHLLWGYRPWLELCARYASPTSASDPLRTSARIRLLPTHGSNPPVLLMGSSQILEGLDCEAFETRFPGRPCQNLAIAGGSPLDTLYLADQVDRRIARRVVITGVSPQTLHEAPKRPFSDLRTLACLAKGGALRRMGPREWLDVLYGQAQDWSETLREKDALRQMWHTVHSDPLAALRFELPPQAPRPLDNVPRPTEAEIESRLGLVNQQIAVGRFTKAQECALFELLDREVRRHDLVIVLDLPTRRGYETTITAGAQAHYLGLLDRLSHRSGIVFVPRSRLPVLGDADFRDFVHIAASGRRAISIRVAELLAHVERN